MKSPTQTCRVLDPGSVASSSEHCGGSMAKAPRMSAVGCSNLGLSSIAAACCVGVWECGHGQR